MEGMKNVMRINKVLFLIAALLVIGSLTGCGEGDGGGSGEFMNPYEAYGLDPETCYQEGNSLWSAMRERPPKALVLEPVAYYRPFYGTTPQSGQFTLKRGESVNLSLNLELIHDSGTTVTVRSSITLKYDGEKEEDLFHVDTNTYGNPTMIKDGLYVTEYGDHNVQGGVVAFKQVSTKNVYNYVPEGSYGELMELLLRTDKGDAQSGDGNIGGLYLKIISVQL